jgi:hypothetical protein
LFKSNGDLSLSTSGSQLEKALLDGFRSRVNLSPIRITIRKTDKDVMFPVCPVDANGCLVRKGFLKQYVRDHLCLRTEPATNDVTDYGVKKAVENLPPLREKLTAICDNYLTVQQDILETFVDRGQLRKLTEPTVLPSGKRIPA